MLRLHWLRTTGKPMPMHLQTGFYPSIAIKVGSASGCHVDRGNCPFSYTAVVALPLQHGFSGAEMFIPQLNVAVAMEERDLLVFPASRYRHMNFPCDNGQNRLAITWFMGNELVKWAERYDMPLFLSGPRLHSGEVPCTGHYVSPSDEEDKYAADN
ncbi:hypothetical protein CC85DRAFT_122549 [Cutaneotrichosporon oleaginosum]|uniref:Fe2OG dioxygenase domain-containing protein n=1 Tax=Cutaneotrichosporon oleaginosum TaxID=879819 RepID=A0A0J0XJP5_9TREE|nr:uncharacterized protein CC85DRAFT_122549 [Cutaneotrichosporon oleaginosum]KLT41335.1 hypothetical protein CC85DRAFT_122549 [Cutaneotrichosporon oleaginosum]TXT06280.1 hypothetical protein COLE_05611 [Cutaneotrichosporon oleaginosum]